MVLDNARDAEQVVVEAVLGEHQAARGEHGAEEAGVGPGDPNPPEGLLVARGGLSLTALAAGTLDVRIVKPASSTAYLAEAAFRIMIEADIQHCRLGQVAIIIK